MAGRCRLGRERRGEGSPEDRAPEPRLPDPGWRLGQPDLVLAMVEPFDVPASGAGVYRYFVIPTGLTRDKNITAIDFRPGAPSVVHHANFFADYSGRARREDAEDAEPGFSVFGTGAFMSYDNTEAGAFGIGGWAPGAEPYSLPDALRTPLRVPAGFRIDAWFVWDNPATSTTRPIRRCASAGAGSPSRRWPRSGSA